MKRLTRYLPFLAFVLLGCSGDSNPSSEELATTDTAPEPRAFARGEFFIEQEPKVGAYVRFDETTDDHQLSVGQSFSTEFSTETEYGMAFDFKGAGSEGDTYSVSVFLNNQWNTPVFSDSIHYAGEPLVFWSDDRVTIGLRPH